ncbi:NUDIX hydrolase [Patescibacteria group bacterium]|nr:NUDIX hydrolase [Patescibacteria group bacterium]
MESKSKRMEEAINRIKKNPDVVRPSIGVFAGIYNNEGKVLLKKRGKNETLSGDWDLPGGSVEVESAAVASDERLIGQELAREVMEETGIQISVEVMPAMYPAVIKGGFDWAFVIPIYNIKRDETKGDYAFYSPKDLLRIAQLPEGRRLVSGVGKRMHRLALMALCHSPNLEYRKEANEMLLEIQDKFE